MVALLHNQLHKLFDPLEKTLGALGLGFPELSLLLILLSLCAILPWIKIFRKAGYSPVTGLWMFVPFVNIIMFLSFAYREWPIQQELRTLDALELRLRYLQSQDSSQ